MAIGRPIEQTPNIADKVVTATATAGQTQFTVDGGYRINHLAVFRNGVRLVNGNDYTALDGSTITLMEDASNLDVLEFQVFDTFNVSDALLTNAASQTVNGDVTVVGTFTVGTGGIGTFVAAEVNVGIVSSNTGITTVQSLQASSSTTTGALVVKGGVGIGKSLHVGGNISVGGTLTYEDVTNVDSVGVVTAGKGVRITTGGLVVTAGVSTFAGITTVTNTAALHSKQLNVSAGSTFGGAITASDTLTVAGNVDIADYIKHTGDLDTWIGFPAADTITAETGGSERLRIDSSGRLLIGTTTEGEGTADNLTIADSGHCGITLRSGTSSVGTIFFSDSTSGTGEYEGYVQYDHTNNFLKWATGNTERMRLNSSGALLLGNDPAGAATYGGQMVIATTTGGVLTCADTGSGERLQIEGGAGLPRIGTVSSHNLAFFTNGTDKERFRIAQGSAGTCTILFGGVTNDSNKTCALALNHYTYNTYNQIDMIKGTSTSGVNKIEIGGSDSSANTSAATSIQLYTAANATTNNGTERLRIASDGEVFIGDGIGVADRSTLLSVSGTNQDPTGSWSQVGLYSNDSQAADKGGSIGFGGQDGTTTKQQFAAIKGAKENSTSGNYAGYMAFYTRPNGSVTQERLRITSIGHMGLGVTPSAWPTNADSKALQIGTGFAAFGRGSGDEDRGGISVNYYTDGSSNYYIGNGNANRIYMNDGNIDFQYASTNSSGAGQALTFVEALRITSSGNLEKKAGGSYYAYNSNNYYAKQDNYDTNGGKSYWYDGGSGNNVIQASIDGQTGNVMSKGNFVVSTAGKGIDFSAQTASSATGATTGDEVLDHYEEGTWTPVLKQDNNTITTTMNSSGSAATYTRVGNLVQLSLSINNETTAGNTGASFKIQGLPFAGNANLRQIISGGLFYSSGLRLNAFPTLCHIGGGAAEINFYAKDSASGIYYTAEVDQVGAGSYFFVSIVYRV